MTDVDSAEVSTVKPQALCPNRCADKPGAALSEREIDVLVWLARGKSGIEVALILGISVCTVRVHIRKMIRKLDASNIPHAVARAFRMGILTSQRSR